MRIELTQEKIELEFGYGDHSFTCDICEAADLLYAAQKRTAQRQRAEGVQPFLEDVRVNILGKHYKCPDPTYYAANEFAKIVGDMWSAEEKKITQRVESLISTDSTQANGQNGGEDFGFKTPNGSEPATQSSEETFPTTGWG